MHAGTNTSSEIFRTNRYRNAVATLRPAIGGVIIFSAILNVLMLTGSIYMLQVYDRVLPGGSVPTLVVLFGIVVVMFAFLAFYDFLRARLLSRSAMRLDEAMGPAAFQRFLATGRADPTDQEDAQAMRDLDTVRLFLSGPTVAAMADVLFVPLFLGVLFLIHPWLGLLTIAGAGFTGILAILTRMLTQASVREGAVLDQAERTFANSSHRNAEAITAMGMAGAIGTQWQTLHRAALHGQQRGSDPSELLTATSRAFRMLLQSAILTLGALLVIRGEISGGMIIASSVLSGRALAPVDQLVGQWRTIGRFTAAHKRLLEVFANTQDAAPRPVALPNPTGEITVEGLTKLGRAVPGRKQARILSDISFSLTPGDTLGIIGNSASGKSTLGRLLVGSACPDAGEIRLDGATPDQWDPASLGRHIGYLPQIFDVLPGSVRDNIARFDPTATDDTVIAAARLTGIHDLILKLPHGYATRLGEIGAAPLLSGGQMQRLGLARAVYGMPRLVVLDEPNANLDMNGNAALLRTIKALRAAGSTVIVIAHRAEVLKAANKLMILNDGCMQRFGDIADVLRTTEPAPQATHQPPQNPRPTLVPKKVPMPNVADIIHSPNQLKRAGPPVVRMAGPARRRYQA
ncbi:type I secretion system permease/ATPase [Loktanella salsilacus]|jgi:ATP-binding cassette subfamily C exporter for protease/lipase|uniref:type I secretion system permease/ATPase n=1 Tax=Loktanella salsilacus TaxID=195913 RepID=UPI003703CCF6